MFYRIRTVKYWSLKNVNKKIRTTVEEDFVIAPKYNNSLAELIKAYPDGVPPQVICRVLGITTLEYEKLLQSAIIKLKKLLVPEDVSN